jgi:ABC-2 type transport system ATP-binding protein
VQMSGPTQPVVTPAGGTPAAITTLPGLGSLGTALGGQAVEIPGQFAAFGSEPLPSAVEVVGAPTIDLAVTSPTGRATLFAKLYDVGPDGAKVLPGSGVSPVRLPALPRNGDAVTVTVALPGIVQPVEAGHYLSLAITTTDQAYATPVEPAAYRIALADNTIAVPVVAGTNIGEPAPVGAIIGILIVLGLVVLLALVMTLRSRRASRADPALADVPLVIDGLAKRYPGGLVAVDDLGFRVERGQVLGLLGPNGAGKTTTLRMLMGLIRPTSGTIRVFGHEVSPGAPVLSRIGSFVEGAGFLPHLSGAANLRLFWAATGRPEDRAHVHEALEIAGLGKAVNRKVRTYSQGMRQRLAIAQAMLGLPDLLVLDEPTNGLDPPQIHQMRAVLRAYAATGRTVLVSSHLLAEVEQTCDHVVVMHKGRLVAAGPVDEIVAGGGEATFRVDQPQAAADVLRGINGVTGVAVDGSSVHAELDGTPRSVAIGVLISAGVAVEQAGPRRRLEDVFLELVGDKS